MDHFRHQHYKGHWLKPYIFHPSLLKSQFTASGACLHVYISLCSLMPFVIIGCTNASNNYTSMTPQSPPQLVYNYLKNTDFLYSHADHLSMEPDVAFEVPTIFLGSAVAIHDDGSSYSGAS